MYYKIFLSGLKQELKNYPLILARSALIIVILWLYYYLWKAIFDSGSNLSYRYETYLWYLVLTEWIAVTVPYFYLSIEEDINSEKIFSALLRPQNYLLLKIFEFLGMILPRLICIGAVGVGFAYYLTNSFIFDSIDCLLITISLILSTFCILLMQGFVGLSAIILKDAAPAYWIWQKMFFVIGGLLVPLFMYPTWLINIAKFTPFYPTLGGVAEIVFTPSDYQAPLTNIGMIILWILILSLLLKTTYKRSLAILLKGDI